MKRRVASEIGPQPWTLLTRIRYYRRVLRVVFIEGDTNTIRVLLAGASFFYAAGLLLPLQTFSRPAFVGMRELAPEWVWATLFALHAIGVGWRQVDLVPRPNWAFAINALGIGLWLLYIGLVTLAIGEYTPSTAMEITVLLAALVALVRTGFNDEPISP